MSQPRVIWTIGHSNHDFDAFVGLLRGEEVEIVVDVRSFPYSRFAPQFNREELEPGLRDAGVRYLFLGDELGGRPSREDHYDLEGHARYDLMAEGDGFQQAIGRLLTGSVDHRLAIMCSEGKPESCHRRLLVGKVLTDRGAMLRHILPGGEVREEGEVRLGGDGQAALFSEGPLPWRSTQSVSRRRRLNTSSAA